MVHPTRIKLPKGRILKKFADIKRLPPHLRRQWQLDERLLEPAPRPAPWPPRYTGIKTRRRKRPEAPVPPPPAPSPPIPKKRKLIKLSQLNSSKPQKPAVSVADMLRKQAEKDRAERAALQARLPVCTAADLELMVDKCYKEIVAPAIKALIKSGEGFTRGGTHYNEFVVGKERAIKFMDEVGKCLEHLVRRKCRLSPETPEMVRDLLANLAQNHIEEAERSNMDQQMEDSELSRDRKSFKLLVEQMETMPPLSVVERLLPDFAAEYKDHIERFENLQFLEMYGVGIEPNRKWDRKTITRKLELLELLVNSDGADDAGQRYHKLTHGKRKKKMIHRHNKPKKKTRKTTQKSQKSRKSRRRR